MVLSGNDDVNDDVHDDVPDDVPDIQLTTENKTAQANETFVDTVVSTDNNSTDFLFGKILEKNGNSRYVKLPPV